MDHVWVLDTVVVDHVWVLDTVVVDHVWVLDTVVVDQVLTLKANRLHRITIQVMQFVDFWCISDHDHPSSRPGLHFMPSPGIEPERLPNFKSVNIALFPGFT